MIIEMRTYRVKSGTRPKFIELMQTKLLPEHKRLGVKFAGPFPSVEDENVLFWMRGFPDATAHQSLTAQFYGGELWKHELAGVIMPILEKYDVVTVEAPEGVVNWS